MKEVWKDIKGYESIYQVSNLGRVKRLAGSPKCLKDRYHSTTRLSNKGYPMVNLSKNDRKKNHTVHRLVALAFIPIPNIKGKVVVNHIDNCRTNNRADNLEWISHSDNLKWFYKTDPRRFAVLEKQRNLHLGKRWSDERKRLASENYSEERKRKNSETASRMWAERKSHQNS